MGTEIQECTLILRRWDHESGIVETSVPVSSLEGLYATCLNTANPALIDRIIIQGRNAEDKPQTVTFVFQSITVTPDRQA